jgi:hypothetical protein
MAGPTCSIVKHQDRVSERKRPLINEFQVMSRCEP